MKSLFRNILWAALGAVVIYGCSRKPEDRITITTSSAEARKLFWEGFGLMERFHALEARQMFQRAIGLDSNFAIGYLGLAMTEMTSGSRYTSVVQADNLAEPAVMPAPRKVGFGISLVNDVNAEMMNEATKRIDKVSPGERLWIRGQRAQSEGDRPTAIASFQELAALYPRDVLAQQLLGSCYWEAGMHDSAVAVYLRIIKLDSTVATAYNMLGYEYQALDKPEQAEAMLRKYTELLPNEANPYDSYAEFLMRSGRFEESIRYYEKALAVDSTFLNAWLGVAQNLTMLNRTREARSKVTPCETVAKYPAEKRALMMAEAISYLPEHNLDSCLAALERRHAVLGEKKDPIETAADADLVGRILSDYRQYDRAAQQFEGALAGVNASDLPAKMRDAYRADYHLRMGCLVAIPQGDLGAAEKHLADLKASMHDTVSTRAQYLIHYFNGRLAMARKDYQTAINEYRLSNPQDPAVRYHLGIAYESTGDRTQAAKSFREAASLQALNSIPHMLVRLRAEEALTQMQNRAG